MPLTPSLLTKLKTAHPELSFEEGSDFSWSPNTRTIHFNPDEPEADALLLHELSHGLLDHQNYLRDIELVTMEAAAWEKASKIAPDHDVDISEDIKEDSLDSYRDWMHARSTCPSCGATGYQKAARAYACPACSGSWEVNEARLCGLKRYKK